MGLSARKILLIQVTLIIILGFSIYANSFSDKFLWDDEFLVKDNVYIKSWVNIPHFFTETIGMGAGREGIYYRPLQMLTYVFDYSVWRLNVFGYHLTNVLLHILVALALYWFVNTLYHKQILSFLTSALFIVHPVHAEVVDYIAGRADSLAVFFIVICLICYMRQYSQKKILIFVLMLLSALAAILSKEYGLIIPVLLLLHSYIFKKKILIKEFVSIVIICSTYILLRNAVLKSTPFSASHTSSVFQRIPGFCAAVAEYLRLLLFPFNLHMEYGNPLFNFNNLKALGGSAVLAAMLVYAFKKRDAGNLTSFSICWFFITLLPVSNIYPINAYMAEHWLYLPSLGFCLITANGIILLYKRERLKPLAVFLSVFILSGYSYLTIKQNSYWREPAAFYKRAIYYAPDSPRLYHNLGKVYLEAGNFQEAVKVFQKAIDMDRENASLYNILGVTYRASGDLQNATFFYQKAISINPKYADSYYNLGNAYIAMNDTDKAIISFRKAIGIAPKNIHAISYYNNLAYIYVSKGRINEAILLYEKALEVDPDNSILHQNIKALYSIINNNK